MSASRGSRRGRWLLALLTGSAACSEIRDFLIPPASIESPTRRDRPSSTPTLAIDDVLLPGETTPSSVGLRSGRIVAITRGRALPSDDPHLQRVAGDGQPLVPALTDAHVHLEGAALLRDAVLLRGDSAARPGALATALGEQQVAASAWLWALGPQPALISGLDADSLQAMAGTMPVWLSPADGHGALLSARACAMLPSPLRERALTARGRLDDALARRAWWAMPRRAARVSALLLSELRDHAARGVVEVHAMAESVATLRMLEALDATGRLPVRVLVYLDADEPATEAEIARVVAARVAERRAAERRRGRSGGLLTKAEAAAAQGAAPSLRDGADAHPGEAAATPDPDLRLARLQGVKLYADGSLGAHSAALAAPYGDGPQAPAPTVEAAAVTEWLARCDNAGLQLAVHAVGDAALERVLSGIAAAPPRPKTALPVRVEHAQVVAPGQLSRLHGQVCSIQPLHRHDDGAFARTRLGDDRMAWSYRAATLEPTCRLLIGSDQPISATNPPAMAVELSGGDPSAPSELEAALQAVAAAVPTPASATPAPALGTAARRPPAERVSIAQAWQLLRRHGPRAAERRVEVGAVADLLLLDRSGQLVKVWTQGRLTAQPRR